MSDYEEMDISDYEGIEIPEAKYPFDQFLASIPDLQDDTHTPDLKQRLNSILEKIKVRAPSRLMIVVVVFCVLMASPNAFFLGTLGSRLYGWET
jgi:hypothetical protein